MNWKLNLLKKIFWQKLLFQRIPFQIILKFVVIEESKMLLKHFFYLSKRFVIKNFKPQKLSEIIHCLKGYVDRKYN